MQTSPSLSSYHQEEFAKTTDEVAESLSVKLELNDSNSNQMEDKSSEGQNQPRKGEFEAGNEGEEDEDFSFVCNDANKSPISADDAFQNGQIRPSFPLFNRELLVGDDLMPSEKDLPFRPAVRKVFIEARDLETETEAAGPYCAWSKQAVEASPESCKKSSSTGFSKLWRFRDIVSRSNSDGRDAFVFLNGSTPTSTSTSTSTKREEKVEKRETSSEKKPAGDVKANAGGSKAKVKKGEQSSLSAHFARNRALKEEDRRRSYLPYRPELVGFFTNVNGGLSRNVHPF